MKYLTEEIHGEKVCLMGHSMGAKIIMETLCEHKDVLLEKVAGTIVIDMPPHADSYADGHFKRGIYQLCENAAFYVAF